jgi:hypothetical protein
MCPLCQGAPYEVQGLSSLVWILSLRSDRQEVAVLITAKYCVIHEVFMHSTCVNCVCGYVCVCVNCVCGYVCVCMYVYMCVCVCVCVYVRLILKRSTWTQHVFEWSQTGFNMLECSLRH